jgi:hypothetical protein
MKRFLLSVLALLALVQPAFADSTTKLVLQVSEGSDQADYALSIANNLLRTDPGAQIQIVAYAKGVDFLVDGSRGKRDEVKSLKDRGVVFKVCNNTLRYRNIDPAKVLPEASTVPYGAIEIARLQQQEGFAYVKP